MPGLVFNYKPNTSYDGQQQKIDETIWDVGQCVSLLNKDWEAIAREIVEALHPYITRNFAFVRAKLNFMWRCPDAGLRHNEPHKDRPDDDCISIIFYLNNADGDSVIFYPEGVTRIHPQENTAVILPADLLHASSNPTKAFERFVLNIVVRDLDYGTNTPSQL